MVRICELLLVILTLHNKENHMRIADMKNER